MTTFPATLDTFLNPAAGTAMDAAGYEHDVQHAHLNDAVAALQARVGINASADPASLDARINRTHAALFNVSGTQAVRFKDGQLQLWDAGYAAADASKPWAALTATNGVLGLSDPITT